MGQYLTDLERLAKYRQMAEQAHEAARTATTLEAKDTFVSLALTWENIISELERLVETDKHQLDGLDPDATLPLTKRIDQDR